MTSPPTCASRPPTGCWRSPPPTCSAPTRRWHRCGDAPLSRPPISLDAAYFDRLYDRDADPWGFASSGYEAEKYAATLAALPSPRYRSALEVGCSIGVLTALLAERCDRLLAVDGSAAPLVEARRRCAAMAHVEIEQRMIPAEFPDRRLDLVVLSEVVYYWSLDDLRRVAALLRDFLDPNGDVVMVHWTGPTDYPLSGDEAAIALIEATAGFMRVITQRRQPSYRIDVLRRC